MRRPVLGSFSAVAVCFMLVTAPTLADYKSDIRAGDRAHTRGDHAAAVRYLTRGIDAAPSGIDPNLLSAAYVLRGNSYSELAKYDLAIRDYTTLIRMYPNAARYRVFRGRTYYLAKNYDRAIKELTDAIRLDPKGYVAYFWRALCHDAQRNVELALADTNASLARNPDHAASLTLRADIRVGLKDYAAAAADAARALSLAPESANTNAWRGITAIFTDGWEVARPFLDTALRLDPKHHMALVYRALGRRDAGDLEGAVADFTTVIKTRPPYASAFSDRGAVLTSLGRLDEAVADLNRATKLQPTRALHWSRLGTALRRQDRPQQALDAYSEAIRLDPDNDFNFRWRAHVSYTLGKYEDSVRDATHAISLNPNAWAAYEERSYARMELGNVDAAFADINRAIELAPRSSGPFFTRAAFLGSVGDHKGALRDFTVAIERAAIPNPAYYYARGKTYIALGETEKARADFAKGVEFDPKHRTDPNHKEGYRIRAKVTMNAGNYEQAIADYSRVIDIGGDPPGQSAAVLALRGWNRLQVGQNKAALADGDAAIALAPKFSGGHSVRGRALRYMGRVDEARSAFDESLRLDPNDVDALLGTASILSADPRTQSSAISYFEKVLNQNPNQTEARNNLAWILATSDDLAVANGAQAVEHALVAVKINPAPQHRDTLAAAYARAGNFDRAVAESKRAIADARRMGLTGLLPELENHLELFRSGRPYIECPGGPCS